MPDVRVADAAREVARRRVARQVAREPVGGPSTCVRDAHSDRYAIRTRNLQDWNLTRCRCAQSVEGKSYETLPRYGFDVSDSVALVSSGIVGISPECSMTRRFSRRGSHVIRLRGLAKRGLRRGAGRGGWLGARGRRRVVALEQARLEQLLELRRVRRLAAARGAARARPPAAREAAHGGGGAPKLSLNTSTPMVTRGPAVGGRALEQVQHRLRVEDSRPPIVWRALRGIVFPSTGASGSSLIQRALRRFAAVFAVPLARRWMTGAVEALCRNSSRGLWRVRWQKAKSSGFAGVLQPLAPQCARNAPKDVQSLPTDGLTDPGQGKEPSRSALAVMLGQLQRAKAKTHATAGGKLYVRLYSVPIVLTSTSLIVRILRATLLTEGHSLRDAAAATEGHSAHCRR